MNCYQYPLDKTGSLYNILSSVCQEPIAAWGDIFLGTLNAYSVCHAYRQKLDFICISSRTEEPVNTWSSAVDVVLALAAPVEPSAEVLAV